MKRTILISILLLSSTVLACAAKKLEGFYITRGNVKVDVIFLVPCGLFGTSPEFQKLQNGVAFEKDGVKNKLKPDDAKEFTFTFDGLDHRMVSVVDNLNLNSTLFSNSPYIFLKVEIDGMIRLLTYSHTTHTPGSPTAGGGYSAGTTFTGENYILQKNNGQLVKPRRLFFRKDLEQLFSDCPELAEDFKKLSPGELEGFIRKYNITCK